MSANMTGVYFYENVLYTAYTGSLAMLVSAVIIVLILLIGTAGREQKKREIIIPQTAGLTPAGYVLPKFILYPPMVFVLTLISAFVSNAACHLAIDSSYCFEVVLITGTLYGLSAVFWVCLYLFFGISLASPGLAVIYVLVTDTVFSLIINEAFGIDRYTPFNLISMADVIVGLNTPDLNSTHDLSCDAVAMNTGAITADIAITAGVTLVLCAGFMLLTLFAVVAKRMDNTFDEVY
jgi:DMSO/TMAO reductase YedYZ heme-binding membrane subunit